MLNDRVGHGFTWPQRNEVTRTAWGQQYFEAELEMRHPLWLEKNHSGPLGEKQAVLLKGKRVFFA